MSEFLQFTFIGLQRGAVYASLAIALVIIFRTTGLLNFAQGEMAMFSTYFVSVAYDAGLPLPAAVVVGVAGGFLLGAAAQVLLVRPVSNRSMGNPLPIVIVTIGLFLGLNGLAPRMPWGETTRPFPVPFGTGSIELLGATLSHRTIGTLLVLASEVAVLWLLFQKTRLGLALRGVASNAESSSLVGIPVNRMLTVGWGLAAAFGTVAGVLSVEGGVDNTLMISPLVFAFAAATLGGFDSELGAVVGGLIVGVFSELVAHYVDLVGQDLKLLPAFVLILLVLLLRPQGLFGRAQVTRV